MTTPDTAPASKTADFHVKEWEYLRTDIRLQIEQSKYLELATVVALAAFYAWFLSVSKPVPRVALLLPVIVALLGAVRSWATLRHIQRMAAYVRTLEQRLSLGTDGLIGWDRTRVANNSKSPELKLSAILFWFVVIAITLVAPCLLS